MTADTDFSAEDQKALDAMRAEAQEPQAPETPAEPAPPAPSAEAPTTQQRTEAQPERQEQPRDDKGKFAAPEKPEAKPEEQKHVPLAALHEEREKRQALKSEFDQYRGTIEERLRLLQDRIKPAEQPKPIDVEAQPLEALKDTRKQVENLTQFQIQQLQRVQFAGHVAGQVNAFRATTPDYMDAYNFGVESTRQELKARGFSDAEIPAILENGEFQLAQEALQRGKNPGQHFYDFAVSRGYKKAQPQQQQQQQAPSALERLAAAEKGQQAAKSLGAPGAAPAATLRLEDLAQMSPDQLAKLSDDDFRRIMGG